ncbi:MAG: Lrp/AsnC family transcriptional regulator [Syntrophomonadaceae bacterium]|nr:Lrp/AsnC family transcriptional regulator [Syntrophomonadaceae bacterium]
MQTDQDIAIVRVLQGDIPLVARPFLEIANQLGISEADLLQKISEMHNQGVIRRFGAILRHRQAGITANAMVVWRVPAEDIERVGTIMAQSPAVTHCYERPTGPDWPYNLYTMIHGRSTEECEEVVQKLAQLTNIKECQLLYGIKEYKKTSMQYFK